MQKCARKFKIEWEKNEAITTMHHAHRIFVMPLKLGIYVLWIFPNMICTLHLDVNDSNPYESLANHFRMLTYKFVRSDLNQTTKFWRFRTIVVVTLFKIKRSSHWEGVLCNQWIFSKVVAMWFEFPPVFAMH